MADANTALIALASVQGATTIVLAGATWWYAQRTNVMSKAAEKQASASAEMAREMREQRFEALRPVVAAKWQIEGGKVGEVPSIRLILQNVGPGVAISVECGFEHPRYAYHSEWLTTLGPQENHTTNFLPRNTSEDKEIDTGVGTAASVLITYEDVFSRLFETSILLEQSYLGWVRRAARYRLVQEKAPEGRGPDSPNVWHTYQVTAAGAMKEITVDP